MVAAGGAVFAGERLPVFPGAEGFGAHTGGGRGGRVIEVTTLNDRGPGSLRAAVDAAGPRLVVFRTGGTIELQSPLAITHPFITIAGQTAPGGGITLKNGPANLFAPLQVKTHEVVIRYLRSRPGPSGKPSPNVDALTIADPQRTVYNVIVDHCSFSWSTDEVVNVWYDAKDVTLQWCIMSEGLDKSTNPEGPASRGPLLGGRGSERISFHHNLIAHNRGRNPMIKSSGVVDVVNNVVHARRRSKW
jgi:pectate lyase